MVSKCVNFLKYGNMLNIWQSDHFDIVDGTHHAGEQHRAGELSHRGLGTLNFFRACRTR